ncbi:MAG: glycosyltransferase family 4 protein [Candidatus Portnoybacteria bacterium]|nr:glycosyltransferase family 4 protein [Candidatus Portnoybacteria bacterium]
MVIQKKICYILPRYDSDDHTHFAHLHDFLVVAAKNANIFLLVESTKGIKKTPLKKSLGVKEVYIQEKSGGIAKCWENFITLMKIRRQGYRNFYVHYSFMSAFNASLIAMIFGGKVFYWNCGLPWQYKRPIWRRLHERMVYKTISYLVTGTKSLAVGYAEHYALDILKIKIMPNWISVSRFLPSPQRVKELKRELGISSRDKVLLFAHRISPRKGAHWLSAIITEVRHPDIKLVIIGDGPERANLEKEFAREISEGKVIFLGWIPNREMVDYYGLADVFLMPSEEEGFPRVLLEAMAAGLPFVAYNVGGVKEITPSAFSHNILPAGDIKQFASAVDKILSWDKRELTKWQIVAALWVSRFETKKVVKRFLSFF